MPFGVFLPSSPCRLSPTDTDRDRFQHIHVVNYIFTNSALLVLLHYTQYTIHNKYYTAILYDTIANRHAQDTCRPLPQVARQGCLRARLGKFSLHSIIHMYLYEMTLGLFSHQHCSLPSLSLSLSLDCTIVFLIPPLSGSPDMLRSQITTATTNTVTLLCLWSAVTCLLFYTILYYTTSTVLYNLSGQSRVDGRVWV